MNQLVDKQFFSITNTESKFTYKLPFVLTNNYKYCCITSATFPKSFYSLVVDSFLYITLDSTEYAIEFKKATYNPISVSSILQQKLIALGVTGTLIHYPDAILEADTNKFTITFSGVSNVKFKASSLYLAHMFGISQPNVDVEFKSNEFVSPICLDYQSHNKIVIRSDLVRNSEENFQEIVSNGVPFNTAISYTCPSLLAHSRIINIKQTNDYRFTITDEESNPIDFNGAQFHFTICVFKTSEIDDVLKKYIGLRLRLMHEEYPTTEEAALMEKPSEGQPGESTAKHSDN